MKNENFKEESSLYRRVGLAKDLEHVNDHCMECNTIEYYHMLSIERSYPVLITPTRYSRTSKRRHEMLQTEEELRIKIFNEDVTSDIKDSHDNFPKNAISDWDIAFDSSAMKLIRNLVTDDNFNSTMQEILTFEDRHTKSFNLALSAPNEMVVSEIDDVNSKQINKNTCKNLKTTSIKLKSKMSENIHCIEKMFNTFKISAKKEINQMYLSSDLLQLAKIEESKENLKLITFYKF